MAADRSLRGGGGLPAVPLVDDDGGAAVISADAAARAGAELTRHGVRALPPAVAVAASPRVVGGVSLSLTSTTTARGGDNTAPTRRQRLVATCGDRTLELYAAEEEGVSAEASARPLGARVLVELRTRTALEGEYGDALAAMLVDPATCALVK